MLGQETDLHLRYRVVYVIDKPHIVVGTFDDAVASGAGNHPLFDPACRGDPYELAGAFRWEPHPFWPGGKPDGTWASTARNVRRYRQRRRIDPSDGAFGAWATVELV